MIIASKRDCLLEFPRLDLCYSPDCNIYQLILHSKGTKCATVFRVRDIHFNSLRYNFKIKFPDYIDNGEYEYYIVKDLGWGKSDINFNDIRETYIESDKEKITWNNNFIVVGNKILVSKFSGEDTTVTIEETEEEYIKTITHFKTVSPDQRVEGELLQTLDILSQGIIKIDLNRPVSGIEKNKGYKRSDPQVITYKKDINCKIDCNEQ